MIEEFKGIIQEGLKIASGQTTTDERFKDQGTLERQLPYFVDAEVKDIEDMFLGTINLKLDQSIEIRRPTYIIPDVYWYDDICETFSFLNCTLIHNMKEYHAYIFRPSMSIHSNHKEDILDIITYKIDDLKVGDEASVIVASKCIKVY
jgi:hypothetical protein